MSNPYYNPIPPRVWSRVQNPCVYIIPESDYTTAYIPLTGQVVSQAQADYEMQMANKGNILQYKGNSARLTKSQKYSQLARCTGPNRTKVFATQSETYTNPNTTGLLRSGYVTYPFPNQIVGAPNNISGPFAYNLSNPNDCSSNSVQDGGTLVCGTYANPCTGQIYKKGTSFSTICNPASASNVPGSSILCWNNKIQTWFPKPRYVMNNSTDKWPINYKGFISAVRPSPPVLTLESSTNTSVTLSWIYNYNTTNCIPISSFNIYQNGILIQTQPYQITSTTIYGLNSCTNYSFYVTAVSNGSESVPSNTVYNPNSLNIIITGNYTEYNNNNYTGIVFEYPSGTIKFCSSKLINLLLVGGGGAGYYGLGRGGGGGGGTYLNNNFLVDLNTYNLTVGNGGVAGTNNGNGGNTTIFNGLTTYYANGGGGGSSSSGGSGGLSSDGITTGGNGGGFPSPYGQSSTYISVMLPFTNVPTTLYLSGGGGQSSTTSYSGYAGYGNGGSDLYPGDMGQSATQSIPQGGYGGGGGGALGSDISFAGTGGNGVVIMWWQNP